MWDVPDAEGQTEGKEKEKIQGELAEFISISRVSGIFTFPLLSCLAVEVIFLLQ